MKPVKNLLLPLAALLIFYGCSKDSISSDPGLRLRATEDSLAFDTVFTTTGSATQVVKILNDHNQDIRLSSVRLMGGASSSFRMNVNGIAGAEVKDVLIPSRDSIYIFVTVQINQNAAPLPFIVTDSIIYNYNGNTSKIGLSAYGRNAHFLRNHVVRGTENWVNDLPYVILGRLTVDSNSVLTINKGCSIYMHADAPFIVNGTLDVKGERYDSTRVTFTGDRLDEPYRDYPASYPGLIFTESSTANKINFATIKNAYQGIVISGLTATPKLTIGQTIIDNAYESGLTAIHTSISAQNLLISNCGRNMVIANGGVYDFVHCTSVSYSNNFIQHKFPVLSISNASSSNGAVTTYPLQAAFTNCIFWGEGNGLVTDEVVVSRQGSVNFSLSFDHVLWRVKSLPQNATVLAVINEQDPSFVDIDNNKRLYNLRLRDNSPALNKGLATSTSQDLDGLPRPVGIPDLGAYEKQ